VASYNLWTAQIEQNRRRRGNLLFQPELLVFLGLLTESYTVSLSVTLDKFYTINSTDSQPSNSDWNYMALLSVQLVDSTSWDFTISQPNEPVP
jgi:hypothetical protein